MKKTYDNILHELNRRYTYKEIASRIKERTGIKYHAVYLRAVAVERVNFTDNLKAIIRLAFSDELENKNA